jgi:6-phosphogluconolactonase
VKRRTLWNRRDFVQIMGCSSLGVMSSHVPWLLETSSTKSQSTPLFAYVGYSRKDQGSHAAGHSEHGIQVFAIEGEHWTPTQAVASDHPSFLTLHPTQRFLYVANEVDTYQNLPSGAIEAYGIDPHDGRLTLLNRQPLSLSGTMPRHLAVSPDGRSLVVAVHGGGAYNVLPIEANGQLGRVSGIVKEAGSGPDREHQKVSHPQTVMFDPTGHRFFGADLGNDRLSVFTLAEGKLVVSGRSAMQPGSGPRHMALHPSGHLLFVANELDASVSCYGYDTTSGSIRQRLQHVAMPFDDCKEQKKTIAMTMHPSGQFLYTFNCCGRPDDFDADGIAVWRVDSSTGALKHIQFQNEGLHSLHAMNMASDGTSLLVLSEERDSVLRLPIDPIRGLLGRPVQVAKAPSPRSVALKYL